MNTFKKEDIIAINDKLKYNCDILMLTANDWSNTGYRFLKSLEIQKINGILIKLHNHIFNYPVQGFISNVKYKKISKYPVIINIDDDNFIKYILTIAEKVKYIWCHASTIYFFKNKPIYEYETIKNKIYIVSHGGTTYREKPVIVSNIFNRFISKTLIQCPDLLDLNNTENENLIYYPVDLNDFTPDFNFKHESKIVFGHNPSTSKIKGSELILNVINSFDDKLIYIGQQKQYNSHNEEVERTSWNEQILKYKKYDVYIETINPSINNKPYGEWGNTCLEAIASGCIVITNSIHLDKYIKIYNNDPPLFIANNKEQLISQINKILAMSRDDILIEKKKQYDWVKKYHCMEKCSQRLVNFLAT